MITSKVHAVMQSIQQLSAEEKKYIADAILKLPEVADAIQSLDDLQSRYPEEWVAVRAPAGEDRYAPTRGCLIAHHPDHNTLWRQVPENMDVYVFFTGVMHAKAFGVAFDDTTGTPQVATLGD